MITIDAIDKKIIKLLLKDARSKLSDIAKDCRISSTTVKNRIERLKNNGIIVKETLLINWAFFGYRYPITIGVNLKPDQEKKICELVSKNAVMMGVDHFIGSYDLCFFAFAKTIQDLKNLKHLIQKQNGVNNVDINIWNKVHHKFVDFNIEDLGD